MSLTGKRKWMPFLLITGTVLGFTLGSFLVYWFSGEFPYEVLAGSLVMGLVLTVIEIIKCRRDNNHLPEVDERIVRNVFHFSAYTSHFFIVVLFVVLATFTLLGREAIPIFYLWIFALVYLFISAIGSFIVRKNWGFYVLTYKKNPSCYHFLRIDMFCYRKAKFIFRERSIKIILRLKKWKKINNMV